MKQVGDEMNAVCRMTRKEVVVKIESTRIENGAIRGAKVLWLSGKCPCGKHTINLSEDIFETDQAQSIANQVKAELRAEAEMKQAVRASDRKMAQEWDW